jgi:hypothetical protein
MVLAFTGDEVEVLFAEYALGKLKAELLAPIDEVDI